MFNEGASLQQCMKNVDNSTKSLKTECIAFRCRL